MTARAFLARSFGGLGLLVTLAAPAGAQLRLTPGEVPQSAIEAPTVQPSPKRRTAAKPVATEQKQASLNEDVQGSPPAGPGAQGSFPRRLPQAEIRSRFFNGTPITSRGRGSPLLYTLVFSKDGVIERTDHKGDKVAGKWKFVGDAYCSRWDGEKKDTCYTVVEDGEIIKVVFFTRAVATWSLNGTPPAP